MGRIKKKKVEVEKNYYIYALIFNESNEVFVERTSTKNLWLVFNAHYNKENPMTRVLFSEYIERNTLPQMYLLSEALTTRKGAYKHCVAWSKLFSEYGYKPIGTKMEDEIQDADEEIAILYEAIKDVQIDDVCAKNRSLYPDFKNSKKGKRTEKSKYKPDDARIEIVLKKTEYENYKEAAQRYGVTIPEYILHHLRFDGVVRFDTYCLEEYILAIDNYSKMLSGIIATIVLSKEYMPADIEQLVKASEGVIKTNQEAKRAINSLCRAVTRRLEKKWKEEFDNETEDKIEDLDNQALSYE